MPPMPALEILRNTPDELTAIGAELIGDALVAAAHEKPSVVFAIVGGRSVGGIFARLPRQARIPWDSVHVFVADERVVPITSDESNFKQANKDFLGALVDSGRLPEANIHPFIAADTSQATSGLDAYNSELDALGGAFDVVLLSAGEDGHCASLFPDHPSVREDSTGFIIVSDSPKPPPLRMSASRRLVATARVGVVVFLGEGKRDALAKFVDPTVGVESCPSKIVAELPRGYLLTDLDEQSQ